MNKAKEIIDHIVDLYDISEKKAEGMYSNVNQYEKAFDGIHKEDIIKAINSYFRYKSDKTRPTLSKIIAMLPENFVRQEKQPTYTPPVPSDLRETYKEARAWYANISSPSYWSTSNQLALIPDIVYAINKTLLDFELKEKELIHEYSGQDGEVSKEVVLALFFRAIKDHEGEVRKHLVLKNTGFARHRNVRDVLGSTFKKTGEVR